MPELLPSSAAVLLLVAGAVLLAVGAETFAGHAAEAADRLGVGVLAVGVLLAGAEPEEAVTAMVASRQGHPALAAGDPVGANLLMLGLALGVVAVMTRLRVGRALREYAAAASAAGAASVLCLRDGVLSGGEGALLLVAYAVAVVWVWRREKAPPLVGELAERAHATPPQGSPGKPTAPPPPPAPPPRPAAPGVAQGAAGPTGGHEAGRPLLLLLLGMVAMVVGGLLAVRGAEAVLGLLGVTESVVGLTVLALATSAETVALLLAARRRDLPEVAVVAVVGAVAYNATVSLGLAALVSPLAVGRGSPVVVVATVGAVLPLALLVSLRDGTLPRVVGALLASTYAATVGWLFWP